MRRFYFLSIGLLCFITLNAQVVRHINSMDFLKLSEVESGIILDVRTPREYSRGHIENSTLISTRDSKFVNKVNLLQKNKAIYVYCLTGSRSKAVANYLLKNGFSKVYNLSRGIMEWQSIGYPLVQSKNPAANESKAYSELEFQSLISSQSLVLVDFHATWCAPCIKLAPIIEKLQQEYSGIATIEKVDVQANNLLKNKYNIESIPGLILFKNGKEIWKHTGSISYTELNSLLNENL